MNPTWIHILALALALASLALVLNVFVLRNTIKARRIAKQMQREAARTLGANFFKNSQR